jgi:hypothetical protein
LLRSVSFLLTKNNLNMWFSIIGLLIISAVNKVACQTAQNLPVVFYTYGQLTALTTTVQWVSLIPCEDSTANYPMMEVSIIQPENPSFSNAGAFTVLEISSCANSFATNCIIGVNYNKNGGQITAYNKVIIPYNSSVTNLAIRYKSEFAVAPISIHVSYGNDDEFQGKYDSSVFNSANTPALPATYFGQFVKLDDIGSVQNEQYQYYYIAFCEKDIIINSQNYYTVDIQVSSDFSTPLAAFDLVGCSAQDIPDYVHDCTLLNDNNPAVITSEDPASIVSIQMSSKTMDLSGGIYVGVWGYGGELASNNAYYFSVEEDPNS